jgi:hypothetical protein
MRLGATLGDPGDAREGEPFVACYRSQSHRTGSAARRLPADIDDAG